MSSLSNHSLELSFGPRSLLCLHTFRGLSHIQGYIHCPNMLMRYRFIFGARIPLRSNLISPNAHPISILESLMGHLKRKELLIPLLYSFLNLSSLNKWHSIHLNAQARNFRAILHFFSILHSPLTVYQDLSFLPPKYTWTLSSSPHINCHYLFFRAPLP